MTILKALEYIQYTESWEKSVLVHTDSRITLPTATKPEETHTPHRTNQN